ncbi:hypothetical protein ACFPK1_14050 [Actinomycetospora rhizophila]|uniref:Cytochrome P450 n=1 Tax=Actinomycetospora rhizophila TaxID=1416876 RepID=A0ABV9ZE29_9PSEU
MTAVTGAATTVPSLDVDPFSHETLENPLPMQAALRDAGPVVHLPRYDLYAVARYAEVRAALVDWQRFPSSAGVGMSNFRPTTTRRGPCSRRSSGRGRCAGSPTGGSPTPRTWSRACWTGAATSSSSTG